MTLIANNNQISDIKPILAIKGITDLNLSTNNITKFGHEEFVNLPALVSLNISYNMISDFSNIYISGNTLLNIDLKGNQIQQIKNVYMPNVQTLDLYYVNAIQEIENVNFASVRIFSLSENESLSTIKFADLSSVVNFEINSGNFQAIMAVNLASAVRFYIQAPFDGNLTSPAWASNITNSRVKGIRYVNAPKAVEINPNHRFTNSFEFVNYQAYEGTILLNHQSNRKGFYSNLILPKIKKFTFSSPSGFSNASDSYKPSFIELGLAFYNAIIGADDITTYSAQSEVFSGTKYTLANVVFLNLKKPLDLYSTSNRNVSYPQAEEIVILKGVPLDGYYAPKAKIITEVVNKNAAQIDSIILNANFDSLVQTREKIDSLNPAQNLLKVSEIENVSLKSIMGLRIVGQTNDKKPLSISKVIAKNLESFYVKDKNNIQNISAMVNFPNLKEITFLNTNLSNIEPFLFSEGNLVNLNLEGSKISDIGPLKNLENSLRRINITNQNLDMKAAINSDGTLTITEPIKDSKNLIDLSLVTYTNISNGGTVSTVDSKKVISWDSVTAGQERTFDFSAPFTIDGRSFTYTGTVKVTSVASGEVGDLDLDFSGIVSKELKMSEADNFKLLKDITITGTSASSFSLRAKFGHQTITNAEGTVNLIKPVANQKYLNEVIYEIYKPLAAGQSGPERIVKTKSASLVVTNMLPKFTKIPGSFTYFKGEDAIEFLSKTIVDAYDYEDGEIKVKLETPIDLSGVTLDYEKRSVVYKLEDSDGNIVKRTIDLYINPINVEDIDPVIERRMKEVVGKAYRDILTKEDIYSITELDLSNLDNTNLLGLNYAVNLKTLNLSGSNVTGIEDLTLPNLTNLTMNNAKGLNAQSHIREDLANRLEVFIAKNTNIGNEFLRYIVSSSSITKIDIEGSDVTKLGIQAENLSNLVLPNSLVELTIRGTKLTNIPNLQDIENLSVINFFEMPLYQNITIQNSSALVLLHVEDLPKLTNVYIRHNSEAEKITLKNLPKLQDITIADNAKLKSINYDDPTRTDTIELLIDLRFNVSLDTINLPYQIIESIKIAGNVSLVNIDYTKLQNLIRLEAAYLSPKVITVDEIKKLKKLSSIELGGNEKFMTVNDINDIISSLTTLRRVGLPNFDVLENIDFKNVTTVQFGRHQVIRNVTMTNVASVTFRDGAPKLVEMNLSGGKFSNNFQGTFPVLEKVSLDNIGSVVSVNINSPVLKSLTLKNLPSLTTITNINSRETLEELYLETLPKVTSLTIIGKSDLKSINLKNLSKLDTLILNNNEKLTTLDFSNIPSIREISLNLTHALKNIPYDSLTSLEIFKRTGFTQDLELDTTGINKLVNLKELDIRWNDVNVIDLSALNLPKLEILKLQNISRVENITLDNLITLELSNPVSHFNNNILPVLTNLTISDKSLLVEFKGNKLQKLENIDFSDLTSMSDTTFANNTFNSLKTVNISGTNIANFFTNNTIDKTEITTFNGLNSKINFTGDQRLEFPALTTLTLGGTSLTKLSNLSLPLLVNLDLSSATSLVYVDENSVPKLVNLQVPINSLEDISNNTFDALTTITFTGESNEILTVYGNNAPSLNKVTLDGVKMSGTFPPDLINERVKTIELKNNTIVENLVGVTVPHGVNILVDSTSAIKNISEVTFLQKANGTTFDLSSKGIETLTNVSFPNIQSIGTNKARLDLRYNKIRSVSINAPSGITINLNNNKMYPTSIIKGPLGTGSTEWLIKNQDNYEEIFFDPADGNTVKLVVPFAPQITTEALGQNLSSNITEQRVGTKTEFTFLNVKPEGETRRIAFRNVFVWAQVPKAIPYTGGSVTVKFIPRPKADEPYRMEVPLDAKMSITAAKTFDPLAGVKVMRGVSNMTHQWTITSAPNIASPVQVDRTSVTKLIYTARRTGYEDLKATRYITVTNYLPKFQIEKDNIMLSKLEKDDITKLKEVLKNNVSVTDEEDGTLTATFKWVKPDGTLVDVNGASMPYSEDLTIRYSVTDSDSNTVTKDIKIRFETNTLPVITVVKERMEVQKELRLYPKIFKEKILDNATVTDVEDGDVIVPEVTSRVFDNGEFEELRPGMLPVGRNITIRYTATDSGGASSTKDIILYINDNGGPVIDVKEVPIVFTVSERKNPEAFLQRLANNASAFDDKDNESKPVTFKLLQADDTLVEVVPSSLRVGYYTIRYTAVDSEGNVSTRDITMQIVSGGIPVITLKSKSISLTEKDREKPVQFINTIKENATVTDEEDGTISSSQLSIKLIKSANNLEELKPGYLGPGTHNIRYEATDSDGNIGYTDGKLTVTYSIIGPAPDPDETLPEGKVAITVKNFNLKPSNLELFNLNSRYAVRLQNAEGYTFSRSITLKSNTSSVITSIPNPVKDAEPIEYLVTYKLVDAATSEVKDTKTIDVVVSDKAPEIKRKDGTLPTLNTQDNKLYLPDATFVQNSNSNPAWDLDIIDFEDGNLASQARVDYLDTRVAIDTVTTIRYLVTDSDNNMKEVYRRFKCVEEPSVQLLPEIKFDGELIVRNGNIENQNLWSGVTILNATEDEIAAGTKTITYLKNDTETELTQDGLAILPVGEYELTYKFTTSANATYTATRKLTILNVGIKDRNLIRAINKQLQRTDLDQEITVGDLVGLTDLDASGMRITSIQGLNEARNLKTLNLMNNSLTSIDLTEFRNLQSLNLRNNKLRTIEGVEGLANLINLDLSRNEFLELTIDFSKLEVLETLNAESNRIVKITDLVSESLVEVNLNNNKINTITKLNLPAVKNLKLDYNELKTFDFSKINPTVVEVYLSNNRLATLSSLDILTKITKLDLSKNLIADAQSITISTLEQLDISNNLIPSITLNLPNLVTFKANDNKLTTINTTSLTSLKELDLSNNAMTTINLTLNELVSLNISGNTLSSLTLNLPKLEILNASNGSITSISGLTLPKLLELDLSGNGISTISSSISLDELKKIDLSNNAIVNVGFLSNIPKIEKVDLSNNQITTVASVFVGLAHLKELNLAGSRIDRLKINNNSLEKLLFNSNEIYDSNLPSLITLDNLETDDTYYSLSKISNVTAPLVKTFKSPYLQEISGSNLGFTSLETQETLKINGSKINGLTRLNAPNIHSIISSQLSSLNFEANRENTKLQEINDVIFNGLNVNNVPNLIKIEGITILGQTLQIIRIPKLYGIKNVVAEELKGEVSLNTAAIGTIENIKLPKATRFVLGQGGGNPLIMKNIDLSSVTSFVTQYPDNMRFISVMENIKLSSLKDPTYLNKTKNTLSSISNLDLASLENELDLSLTVATSDKIKKLERIEELNAPKLKSINLNGKLTNETVVNMNKLDSLETLKLNNNNSKDLSLLNLLQMKKLKQITLDDNLLTDISELDIILKAKNLGSPTPVSVSLQGNKVHLYPKGDNFIGKDALQNTFEKEIIVSDLNAELTYNVKTEFNLPTDSTITLTTSVSGATVNNTAGTIVFPGNSASVKPEVLTREFTIKALRAPTSYGTKPD